MMRWIGFLLFLLFGSSAQVLAMDIYILDKNEVETDRIAYEELPVKKRCCIYDVVGKFRWIESLYIGEHMVRSISDGSYLNDTKGYIWEEACSPGEAYSDIHDLAPADYRFECKAVFEESDYADANIGEISGESFFTVVGDPWQNFEFKVTDESELEKSKFSRGERIRAVVSLDHLSKKGRFYAELISLDGIVVTKKYGPVYDIPPAVVWKDPVIETIDLGTPDVGSYQVQLGYESDGIETLIDSTLTMIEVSRPAAFDKLTLEVCSKGYCIDSSSKYKELPDQDFKVSIGLENIRVDHQVCYTIKKGDKILIDQCDGWHNLANDENWTYTINPMIISDGTGNYSAQAIIEHEYGKEVLDLGWSLVSKPNVVNKANIVPVIAPLLLK